MRSLIVRRSVIVMRSVIVGSLLLGAMPAAIEAQDAAVWKIALAPEVTYGVSSDLYNGSVTVRDVPELGPVGITLSPKRVPSYGGFVAIRLGETPWALRGGVSFAALELDTSFCTGGGGASGCERGTFDDGRSRTITLGLLRELPWRLTAGSRLEAQVAGVATQLRMGDAEDRVTLNNRGILFGLTAVQPLTRRVALQAQVSDAVVRVDTGALERMSASGGEEALQFTGRWQNTIAAGLGLRVLIF